MNRELLARGVFLWLIAVSVQKKSRGEHRRGPRGSNVTGESWNGQKRMFALAK
jgi:hypothetical protein